MRNLVLLINNYWKQQTENNKTQIMFIHWLKTVTSSSRFCINITHLNESETLITVMLFFLCRFFIWSRNYYHDNNNNLVGSQKVRWLSSTWHPESLVGPCWPILIHAGQKCLLVSTAGSWWRSNCHELLTTSTTLVATLTFSNARVSKSSGSQSGSQSGSWQTFEHATCK